MAHFWEFRTVEKDLHPHRYECTMYVRLCFACVNGNVIQHRKISPGTCKQSLLYGANNVSENLF